MKKLKVTPEACIGCGACVAIAPEHFVFNDNGLSEAIKNEDLESAEVINAIESCPTAAISIVEVSEECDCKTCECEDCHCGEEECCEDECNCEDECDCCECDCEKCTEDCACECENCSCNNENEEN